MDPFQAPTGDPELDALFKQIRNVRWAATPLGPLEQWPQDIAVLLSTVMVDPSPRLLLLGPDNNMLYNPAYGNMIGELHPRLLGMPVLEGWPSEKELTMGILEKVRMTGRAHVQDDVPFSYVRNGVCEDTLLSWCTLPLKSQFGGFYIALTDVTEARVGERRQSLLKSLADSWSVAPNISALWLSLSESFAPHPKEFPVALLYLATPDRGSESLHDFVIDAREASRFALKSINGEASQGNCVDSVFDVNTGERPYHQAIRRAVTFKEPQLLHVAADEVPESWIHAASGRSHGEKLVASVVVPVKSNRTGVVVGILILGLNTRRPWNESYRNWISELGRQISDTTTSLLLAEDSIRKQHNQAKQAAEEQILLAKELAFREREASDAHDKARRLLQMMQDCDVGIFEYSADGKLLQANDAWYQLSGHPRPADMHTEFSFMDCVYEPDADLVIETWKKIAQGNQVTFEMRWKPPLSLPGEEPPEDGVWVLSSCIPVMDKHGNLKTISGCTTSIGPQKRVVRDALKRAEALEQARASEKKADLATERFLRMTNVIEQMDVGVFEYAPDGILLQANDAYYDISGIDRERASVNKLTFTEAIFPDDLDHVISQWEIMVKGTPTNFEVRWKAPHRATPGGKDPGRWTLAACIPSTDDKGNVLTIFGCITDIDAQKRAETDSLRRAEALERARASERRFVRFTESSAVPIYIIEHPSKAITYCNDAWYKMTGLSKDDGCNPDWRDAVLDEDIPVLDRLWDVIIGNSETVSIQFRLKRTWTGANGEALLPIWVMATANPEFNEDGSVKGIMGTMSDITGFKWAEISQQVRVDEALEAKRQQENFIDMTSHEIRNPLGAVVHCADSIADNLKDMKSLTETLKLTEHVNRLGQLFELIDSSIDAVNTIQACSSHQKNIVDDILVLSKLDSNLLQIAPSPVFITDIIRDVTKMFVAEAQRAGVSMKADLDRSLSDLKISYALLDTGRVLQILINLVTNAIKFTKNRATRQVTIRMGASIERPSESELHVDFALSHSMRDSIYDAPEFAENTFYLWFTIEDTGRGMTADEKAKIFSRFTQGSPRTYSEYGGSGLGLFISRELAGLQGGEIGVASEAGEGSTFAFFVKTRHTSAPTSNVADLPIRKNSVSLVKRHAAPRDISLLVTEDNLLNQRVLKKQLTKHGYKVYTADNGQEALDFLKTTRHWKGQESKAVNVDVDVILMDIEMPVMGGLESARWIRQFQKQGDIQGHIPIIAVSANARAEQTSQALSAGMDDAISKPFRIVDLIPKIDKLASWGTMVPA